MSGLLSCLLVLAIVCIANTHCIIYLHIVPYFTSLLYIQYHVRLRFVIGSLMENKLQVLPQRRHRGHKPQDPDLKTIL